MMITIHGIYHLDLFRCLVILLFFKEYPYESIHFKTEILCSNKTDVQQRKS